MKIIALAAAGLLALLFRGGRQTKTPWSGAGLPVPVATLPELEQLATALAAALRARAAGSAGLVRQFQRAAGLLAAAAPLTPEQIAENLEIERRLSAERWSEDGLTSSIQTTPGFDAPPTASGVYDARTRQALGYYGRLWVEQTP